jgi:hypothetical protein
VSGAPTLRAAAAAAGALALLAAATASAHPLAPSLLELEERGDGGVLARFTAPRVAGGARALPVLPARCRPLGEPRARAEEARVVSEQLLDCGSGGLAGAEVAGRGLAESASALIVHVSLATGAGHQALLAAGRPSFRVPERPSAARVLGDYARLGAAHLAGGLDHLLVVAGLFLLLPARRLLATLAAFTLGHCATLTLAALGVPLPPAPVVDAGIAASLLALALALAGGARPLLAARPALACGALGLLHGLGFAGALREIGLPEGAVPLALFSFNAGIELAQLTLVALLAAAVPALRAAQLPGPRLPAPILASHALGAAGAFLLLERLAGAFAR